MKMNNTLIVYTSRHGTTAAYARKLKQLLDGNVDICFLDERGGSLPDLTVYDTFVIGGSIHFGKNSKSIVSFSKNNLELLKNKRLGLFVSCHFEDGKALEQLSNAYPKELLNKAIVSDYFDGELLFPKMNFWEKLVARVVLKKDEINPRVSKEKVTRFADKLNRQK